MFKALDYVNYDGLEVNARKPPNATRERTPTSLRQTPTLQELCCDAINDSADIIVGYPQILVNAVRTLPLHLVPMLLRVAINNHQCSAITNIISAWPFHTLSFREVLGTKGYDDIFLEEMGFDLVIFRGLLARRKCCKMRCLDLRSFKLNKIFSKLIVQMWPLISLKRRQMNTKRLARIITKTAGFSMDGAISENLPSLLKETLDGIMSRYSDIHIDIPRGQKLLVKLDSLQFSPGDTFYLDYLISNCLRSVTPVQIQVSHLYFRTGLFPLPLEMVDRFTPFIVINGHDTESLEGLSLRQLEDGVFAVVAHQLKKFSNVKALELQDCNIYLQEGRTRSRTAARTRIMDFLSSFPYLTRLDLSFNYLLGCLGEVLSAVTCPLQYLNLRGCDLDESDLRAISSSKHAASLRELNLSKICQVVFFYPQDRVSPAAVVTLLRHLPKLTILNIAQNHIPDAVVPDLCSVLSTHLKQLKVLDLAANVLTQEHQIDIASACAKIPSMQKLRLTTVTSFVQELGLGRDGDRHHGDVTGAAAVLTRLRKLGRGDIMLETVNLSRAIFIDIVDDLNNL